MRKGINILGAGPVGLVAALRMAMDQRVDLYVPLLPSNCSNAGVAPLVEVEAYTDIDTVTSVESVPVGLLGLLVELGVHPSELGIERLHDIRRVSWEDARVAIMQTSRTAYVKRPHLERALMRRALSHSNINVMSVPYSATGQLLSSAQGLLLDATGRRARTAVSRRRLTGSPVARTWTFSAALPVEERAFRIAALPDGYVYRIATGRTVLVGWVGSPALVQLPREIWNGYLQENDASWMASTLFSSLDAECSVGKAGHAGVQWATPQHGHILLGDAAYARDVLGSQGLAVGISDALYAVAAVTGKQYSLWSDHRHGQFLTHLLHLKQIIESCKYRHMPFWNLYAHSIEQEIAFFASTGQTISMGLRQGKIVPAIL